MNKFPLPRFFSACIFPTPRRQSRTSGGPPRAVRAVPAGNSRQHLHQRPADGHLRWHSVLFRARLLRQQIAAHLSAEQWRVRREIGGWRGIFFSFVTNFLSSVNSPGSSSSGSEWSPSPLPPIDSEGNLVNPDRLMGAPVGPKLPSINRLRSSYGSTQSTSSDD